MTSTKREATARQRLRDSRRHRNRQALQLVAIDGEHIACPECGAGPSEPHVVSCELKPVATLESLDDEVTELDSYYGVPRRMLPSEARMHRRIRDRIEPDDPYSPPDSPPPGWEG